jgi:hypothetical protein
MTDAVLGHWVAAFFVGKTLGASLAASRSTTVKILAYGIGVPACAVLASFHLRIAALVALAGYLAYFRRVHLFSLINHVFVEFLLLIVVAVMANDPVTLLSVLQVMVVTVWAYSVWQKLFHGQFLDGTVMYWLFAMQVSRSRLVRALIPDLRPLQPGYTPLIPSALRRCRLMARSALFGEAVMPLLAFALSGSPLAVVCLLALAIPVGVFSTEDDFMVTNVILSFAFLARFDPGHLTAVFITQPIVAAILAWGLLWPLIHPFVMRRLGISSWRMFGYGMYASIQWNAFEITRVGDIRPFRGARVNVLSGFGASRSPLIRNLALSICFGRSVSLPEDVIGFCIRRRYRVADTLVSQQTIIVPGRDPVVFDIRDAAGHRAFLEHIVSTGHP